VTQLVGNLGERSRERLCNVVLEKCLKLSCNQCLIVPDTGNYVLAMAKMWKKRGIPYLTLLRPKKKLLYDVIDRLYVRLGLLHLHTLVRYGEMRI
jgi:hypothetical protein